MAREVSISPLQAEDFATVAEWLSAPEINRWLGSEWRGKTTTSRMIAVATRNPGNRLYMISMDGTACGLVGLSDIDAVDRVGMVWYLLGDKAFAGTGVVSTAVGLAADLAFSELGLATVYAWIMSDNSASRRVLEKNGFRECGAIRQSASSGGVQVDRVYFDLCADDSRS